MRISRGRLTPSDDRLAVLLADLGYSYRRIAELMRVSDKTAKACVARGRSEEVDFLKRHQKQATEIFGFMKWLEMGRKRGYIKPLASLLDGADE